MADLSITAASVLAASTVPRETVTAGETITQGMAVFKLASDGKWYKSAGNLETLAPVHGVSLTAASTNQPLVVGLNGLITIGATLSVGKIYVISGATGGGIRPVDDVTAGDFPSVVGIANSTTVLNVQPITCTVAAAATVS
jgi:hypothetical protein